MPANQCKNHRCNFHLDFPLLLFCLKNSNFAFKSQINAPVLFLLVDEPLLRVHNM